MFQVQKITLLVAALCCWLQISASSAIVRRQTSNRILIVGDSITQGAEGDLSWRYRLWQWLKAENIDFEFVGPWTGTYEPPEPGPPQPPKLQGEPDPPPVDHLSGGYAMGIDTTFDKDHFAHSGRKVIGVKDEIAAIVSQHNPDYILLELGFNDLGWFASGAEGLLVNMKTLIDNARFVKSNLKFAIANVPYRTRIGGREDLIVKTDQYNALLEGAVPQWSTTQSPIDLVRFRENYRCELDECPAAWDGLHPNQLGEYTIAQAFSRSLNTRFGIGTSALDVPANLPPPPCPVPMSVVATPTAFGVAVTWNKVYGARGYRVKTRRSTLGTWSDVPYQVPTHRYNTIYVLEGETWDYQVQTDCGDALKSGWSDVASTVVSPSVPPGPKNLVVNPAPNGFSARWEPPDGSWNIDRYEVIAYDKDRPCDFQVINGIKGTSITVNGLNVGHSYIIAVSTWSYDGPGFPTISFSVVPGRGAPAAPGSFSVATKDPVTVILRYTGDDAAANYRVWTRNINNASDFLKADNSASDIECYGITWLFPGVWNYEFCVTALNGNLESARSNCIIASQDTTPGVTDCSPAQPATCEWGGPGDGGDGSGEPGSPGGGGGEGGEGGEGGSGDVYIDPSIWRDPTPEISCRPPCFFILPPLVLPSLTTIILPPYTTDIEVAWTEDGTITRSVQTTTIPIPPVTTNTISFWHQTFPPGPGFTFIPTPRINPPPIIVTNSPNPAVTRTITPYPYPTNVNIDDEDYGGPFPSITVVVGPPAPICSGGCGSPCYGGSCGGNQGPCIPLLTCPRGQGWEDPSDPDEEDEEEEEDPDPPCPFPPLASGEPIGRAPDSSDVPDIRYGAYPGPYIDDDGGGFPTQRLWIFYNYFLSEVDEYFEWYFVHRPLDGSAWDVCDEENDVECDEECPYAPDGELSQPPWPNGEWTMTRGGAEGCTYRSNGLGPGTLTCEGQTTIPCGSAAEFNPEVIECPAVLFRSDFYAAVVCEYT